ncbi:MAG: 50S ribosomal protein L20 [bacterium]
MPRVKRGKTHLKHRKNILKATKGFKWGRKSKIKLAKTAATKAGVHAYVDRRLKKRIARGLWQVRINASLRPLGMSYSKFMGSLKKAGISLDRKVLASLAVEHPEVIKKLAEQVK